MIFCRNSFSCWGERSTRSAFNIDFLADSFQGQPIDFAKRGRLLSLFIFILDLQNWIQQLDGISL
jgi:hypothetical protein